MQPAIADTKATSYLVTLGLVCQNLFSVFPTRTRWAFSALSILVRALTLFASASRFSSSQASLARCLRW